MVRPLSDEPLPLDLLNTVWVDGDVRYDLLDTETGMRAWLAEHRLTGPTDAAARRALTEAREALRAWLLDDAAAPRVDAVLARGASRTLVDGRREVDAAAAWRIPWVCADALVTLRAERGDRIRGCANPHCVLWFLDTTRPGTRRWCSMAACGNRDKAIRHGRTRA